MPNVNYSPGGTGGYGPPTNQSQYNPTDPFYKALGDYTSNANSTSQWLSQMLASNQAAAKKTQDAATQQMQNQQDTAAQTAPASATLQGAEMGSVAGPWGALAGGIIGSGVGAAKDFMYRNSKPGASTGQSLLHAGEDLLNPVNMYNAITGQGGSKSGGAQATNAIGSLVNKPGAATKNTPPPPGVSGDVYGGQGNFSNNPQASPGPGWWMDANGKWNAPYQTSPSQWPQLPTSDPQNQYYNPQTGP